MDTADIPLSRLQLWCGTLRDDQNADLPANDTFAVRMNKMGTKGVNGIKVDTFSSGSGGTKTYDIYHPG